MLLALLVAWSEAPDDRPAPPVPDKEEAVPPPALDAPGQREGSLSGKAVYLSQCHGWIYSETLDRFATQRGNLYDTVEDFHNPEGANEFLVPLLENAGARVFTTRERDPNPRMAIADNDGEGYSESGSGFEDGPLGFSESGPWDYGQDPFNSGTTRRFPANGDGVATWVPEVPADGLYVVYVSWDSDSANSSSALYRIHHPGGVLERRFDQRVHGSTWQYVERLWLPQGVGGLTVELVADGGSGLLSADAVRIGGGTDDIRRVGDLTGRPRWESGGIQYIQYNGAPTSVYDPYGDGDGSDPSSRSRWADWEHPSGEDAIYLSWHSNAGGGTGTSTYTTSTTSSSTYAPSKLLAGLLQDELVEAIRVFWDSDWTSRGLHEKNFSEIDPKHNDEMPAALVELAFHDHSVDVELLKDPRFRWDASRAMLRAIVGYFATQDGVSPAFSPEPPQAFSALQDADGLQLSWQPGLSGAPYGDAPTGYRLYTSQDGRSWDEGSPLSGASTTLALEGTLYLRLTATNPGGESFPTPVLAARAHPAPPILLVAAFDRLDSGLLRWEEVPTLGDLRRFDYHRTNPQESLVAHAEAMPWPFDSTTDEALPDLEAYELVVWMAGEESTHDETFSSGQQELLRAYVEGGGALWVSGAELMWDLDTQGSDQDLAFALEVLGARLQEDDAGTTQASGTGLLEGLDLSFGEEDGAPYPVEYPDVLRSEGEELALYGGGGLAGVRTGNVAVFGFPFESIGAVGARTELAARLVPVLAGDWTPRDTGETGDPKDDTGPHEELVGAGPGERVLLRGCATTPGKGGAGLVLLLLTLRARRPRRRPCHHRCTC